MRANKHSNKAKTIDMGGSASSVQPSDLATDGLEQNFLEEDALYLQPPTPPKRHSAEFINHKRKVRQVAEERLISLSDELLKLANEVRYLNPLVAELLDEALESTEAALGIVSADEI